MYAYRQKLVFVKVGLKVIKGKYFEDTLYSKERKHDNQSSVGGECVGQPLCE